MSCISFDSYIKPQLVQHTEDLLRGCISFDSYIKPQLPYFCFFIYLVVYLLTPTSNHNFFCLSLFKMKLYIFWLLHQTTTSSNAAMQSSLLYIFWLLHQTTTYWCVDDKPDGCISFDSYIKPQRGPVPPGPPCVVYLLTPTSNHNHRPACRRMPSLYIFWLLHQTTTYRHTYSPASRCISFDSYIKPQLHRRLQCSHLVVYLLTPTSNHNFFPSKSFNADVVYLLTPTSNHNFGTVSFFIVELYIFWLLHQTTTVCRYSFNSNSCISFDSYIKPQL